MGEGGKYSPGVKNNPKISKRFVRNHNFLLLSNCTCLPYLNMSSRGHFGEDRKKKLFKVCRAMTYTS